MLWMFLYCKSFRSSKIDCWAHFMPMLEEKTKSLLTPIFEPFTRDFKSCMLLRWRLSPRRWENWKRNGLTSIPKIRRIRRETGIWCYARLKKQRLTNLSADVARMNWWCHFEIACWGQTKSLLTPTFASLRELSNVAYSYPCVSYRCWQLRLAKIVKENGEFSISGCQQPETLWNWVQMRILRSAAFKICYAE